MTNYHFSLLRWMTCLMSNELWAKKVQIENISSLIYIQLVLYLSFKLHCQEYLYILSDLNLRLDHSKNEIQHTEITSNLKGWQFVHSFLRSIYTRYLNILNNTKKIILISFDGQCGQFLSPMQSRVQKRKRQSHSF